MSMPEQEPIPFEDLPAVAKPERCDFHFTSPPSVFDKAVDARTIIGYRMGDPNIYYSGGFSFNSSTIPLLQPLEDAPLEKFQDVLLWEKDKFTLFRLWNSAQNKKHSSGDERLKR